MSKDYNILAKYIVKQYIDRISGNDIGEENQRIVTTNLTDQVMVGMLAANRVEQKLTGGYKENRNTRFQSVPSISLNFFIQKGSVGNIYVMPTGYLFYNVQPTYEEIADYFIKKFSIKDRIDYKNIQGIIAQHQSLDKFELPKVFKKLSLEKILDKGIRISVSSLKEGVYHYEDDISQKLNALCSDVITKEIRIITTPRISLYDIVDKRSFAKICTAKEEHVSPRWKFDIVCNIKDKGDSYLVSMQLVNNTPVAPERIDVGYAAEIYNAGIKVIGEDGIKFKEIKLDYFKNTYKKREPVYSVAENATSKFIKSNNEICTENVPVYCQYRVVTNDQYNSFITFDYLISDPVKNLEYILCKMQEDFKIRKAEYIKFEKSNVVLDIAKKKFKEDLLQYRQEIDRFAAGIKQIKYKDAVKNAFVFMNKTFKVSLKGEQRNIIGWRLFQIVFIVSLICEVIRSEYKDDEELKSADIEVANLLYFPTGGGKTEAFLGITIFTMFFDRLRGKNDGLSAFIKYPLRLLAVQQLERVLTVIIKANIVRQQSAKLAGTREFSLGFYVGTDNTPNSISCSDDIVTDNQDNLNESYRFIDTCPVCGKKTINVRFNKKKWTLEHYCDNKACSIETLPLYIVDDEIYRYLPSVVVSIADKMALVGINSKFKMLFGQVNYKCPVHGFQITAKCKPDAKNVCNERVEKVEELKDPIPTLFIQDELHLVKESLGTFDSHYETFLNYYAQYLVPENQRKQLRFIGATATISMFKPHIRNLYHVEGRRFPCEYPSTQSGKNFYSFTDNSDITRLILGYAPYGHSIINGVWESVYFMRNILYDMINNPKEHYLILKSNGYSESIEKFKEQILVYWIELVYNTRKQDVMELDNVFQNQANNLLEEKCIPKFKIRQMTSDSNFQSVRKTLFDIQANEGKLDSTNLLLATSTISHGVDEDLFNIMYFYGMPNNNAEYIQAYSRTGRKYTGIVIDIIRLLRERDRAYLKNFIIFHQNRDELIEAVPINRWAKNAIYSTLPGLLTGILLQYYGNSASQNLYKAINVKKMLNTGEIVIEDVIEHLKNAYACNANEKMSMAYEEIISEEVTNILGGIKSGIFSNEDWLSDTIGKFSHGAKTPMRSLRDTEEQVTISIK